MLKAANFKTGGGTEYISAECKELSVCFIYHQPYQTGTCAL